ncbi:MAG: hypothetical protein HYY06_14705 [Deltaproteobacteria bacterium]|nr:hypothetical protein [Deltaproteobacteria bacterium]
MRSLAATLLMLIASQPAAFAREPRIDEVQAAAVRTAHADPSRAEAAADRARAAGLLPALRVRVARDLDRDQSLDLEPGASDQLGLDASDRLVLEVRAEWDLSRLAYEPDELHALESASRLARDRREAIETVTRLYFERLRLVGRLARAPDPEARSRLGEVTAILDALTGGYFGRQLRRRP